MIETSKRLSYMDIENNWQSAVASNNYSQWSLFSFRNWVDGTKIEKTQLKIQDMDYFSRFMNWFK